jgi:uncharacterized membrane protein YqjE
MRIDPDSGIPDLVRSLADDSRRLAADEVRLAKLELNQSVHLWAAGAIRIALSLAFGIVAAVALTVLLVVVISRATAHYWSGAMVVGALELIVGAVAVRRGVAAIRSPKYSLLASRESLKDTAAWLQQPTRR